MQQSIQLYDLFQKVESLHSLLQTFVETKKGDLKFGKYQIKKYLGKGSFAKVFKAKNIQTDKTVALKIIDLQEIDQRFKNQEISQKARKYLLSEETNMQKCKSAYVLKLYESFTNEKCKILVMEYCNGATMEHYLKRKGKFKQSTAVIMLKQIIFGLGEMHRNGIVHRDLKPANILVHNGILKIADLGFSKELSIEEALAQHTVLGTRSTMAPEVTNQQAYSFKADIWSLGVIFFLMLYYDRDYSLPQNYRKVEKFIQLKDNNKLASFQTQSVSLESIDFLRRTLEIQQTKRLDWEETLDHPIFIRKNQSLPESFNPCKESNYSMRMTKVSKEEEVSKQEVSPETEAVHQQEIQGLSILARQYFECRKIQFLLNKLVVPLEQGPYLDKKNQSHLELMLLLVLRCKNTLSRAQTIAKNNYDEQVVDIFSSQINGLDERIKIKCEYVDELLKAAGDKFRSMIKQKMNKLINKDDFNEKQKFLTGQEGVDFNRDQQIVFTYEKYIVDIVKEIKFREESQSLEVQKLLKNFKEIALLEENDLKGSGLAEHISSKIK